MTIKILHKARALRGPRAVGDTRSRRMVPFQPKAQQSNNLVSFSDIVDALVTDSGQAMRIRKPSGGAS
jgi:hypothetical protein